MTFIKDFINTAHPSRFWQEQRAFPRIRDRSIHGAISQRFTNRDIEQGWCVQLRPGGACLEFRREYSPQEQKAIWKRDDVLEQYPQYFYKHYACHWKTFAGIFKHHVHRRAGDWVFASYYEKPVSFYMIDFDNHDGTDESANRLKTQVLRLKHFVQTFGGDVMFTTSPGDLYGGQHVQGVYGWIKLTKCYTPQFLIDHNSRFLECLGLDVETSWKSKNRAIRLFGQEEVELIDPYTLEKVDPLAQRDKPIKRLEVCNDAWTNLAPVDLEEILFPASEDFEGEFVGDIPKVEQSPFSVPAERTTGRIPNNRTYSSLRWNQDDCLSEKCTFTAFVKSHIGQELAHRYRGDERYREVAVREAIERFKEYRPSDSKTCSDPNSLRAFLWDKVGYFFESYDESRRVPSWRKGKDKQDKKVFESSRFSLTEFQEGLRSYFPKLHDEDVADISRFYGLMLKFDGRVSVYSIYESPKANNPLFTHYRWKKLLKMVGGGARIVDLESRLTDIDNPDVLYSQSVDNALFVVNHVADKKKKVCRQYCLSSGFIRHMKELFMWRVQDSVREDKTDSRIGSLVVANGDGKGHLVGGCKSNEQRMVALCNGGSLSLETVSINEDSEIPRQRQVDDVNLNLILEWLQELDQKRGGAAGDAQYWSVSEKKWK